MEDAIKRISDNDCNIKRNIMPASQINCVKNAQAFEVTLDRTSGANYSLAM